MTYNNKDSQTIRANSREQARPCNELHTVNNATTGNAKERVSFIFCSYQRTP